MPLLLFVAAACFLLAFLVAIIDGLGGEFYYALIALGLLFYSLAGAPWRRP